MAYIIGYWKSTFILTFSCQLYSVGSNFCHWVQQLIAFWEKTHRYIIRLATKSSFWLREAVECTLSLIYLRLAEDVSIVIHSNQCHWWILEYSKYNWWVNWKPKLLGYALNQCCTLYKNRWLCINHELYDSASLHCDH